MNKVYEHYRKMDEDIQSWDMILKENDEIISLIRTRPLKSIVEKEKEDANVCYDEKRVQGLA